MRSIRIAMWLVLALVLIGELPHVSAENLSLTSQRGYSTVVTRPGTYDYAPTVMLDGRYRMYWCGYEPSTAEGDSIMYAEAYDLAGPWSTPVSVLHRSGSGFDANHTCDPSIVRARGTYYLYYGGLNESTHITGIGVAYSSDGVHWARLNNGAPIVMPRFQPDPKYASYGAGQPSVVYRAPYFYMVFTDSTHRFIVSNGQPRPPQFADAYCENHASPCDEANASRCSAICSGDERLGQWVIRSQDPTFQTNVQVLKESGFVTASFGDDDFDIHHGFGADLAFSDVLDRFVIVDHHVAQLLGDTLRPSDSNLYLLQAGAGRFCEQSGVVRTPEGHLPPSRNDLRSVPIDVFYDTSIYGDCGARAPGDGPEVSPRWYSELAWAGGDLASGQTVSQLAANGRLGRVLEGFRATASGRADVLIKDGRRVRFAQESVATLLTHNAITLDSAAYDAVPAGAQFLLGANVLNGPPGGNPAAFLPGDGKKWLIGCPELITRNASPRYTSDSQYASTPVGGELFCLSSAQSPIGFFDEVFLALNGVRVRGWSMDPDDPTASTSIVASLSSPSQTNGAGYANRYRVDVDNNVDGADGYQGYDANVGMVVPSGTSTVCVTAFGSDLGPSAGQQCKTVTNSPPMGWFDAAAGGTRSVRVQGWTKDPDTVNDAATIRVINGANIQYCTANVFRSDVGAHGFDCTVTAPSGPTTICIQARDTSLGPWIDIGMSCRAVTVN